MQPSTTNATDRGNRALAAPVADAQRALVWAQRGGGVPALAELARAGARLHRLVTHAGPAGADSRAPFRLADHGAGVPWTCLYGLTPPPRGRARLCTSYERHARDGCPERAVDAATVCPNGFWGLRYAVDLPGIPATRTGPAITRPLARQAAATSARS